jgi:hypothetical protein
MLVAVPAGLRILTLKNGAKKVIAVDVGTDQLHPTLLDNPKIELHEKTDIRDYKTKQKIDIALVDVSFVSLKTNFTCYVSKLLAPGSQIVAMFKPQFEAGDGLKHKGVIKNQAIRRQLIKDFEVWLKKHIMLVLKKADSGKLLVLKATKNASIYCEGQKTKMLDDPEITEEFLYVPPRFKGENLELAGLKRCYPVLSLFTARSLQSTLEDSVMIKEEPIDLTEIDAEIAQIKIDLEVEDNSTNRDRTKIEVLVLRLAWLEKVRATIA